MYTAHAYLLISVAVVEFESSKEAYTLHEIALKMANPITSFTSSLKIIYIFSRVCGLLPFSVARQANGEIRENRVNVFDFLWFIVWVLVMSYLAINCVNVTKFPENPNIPHALTIGHPVLITLGYAYAAIGTVFDMCNRFKLMEMAKSFTAFDKEVSGRIFIFTNSFHNKSYAKYRWR